MCGLVGWIGGSQDEGRVREAVRRLRHRGPDDEGVERWVTPAGEAWLGFRRLAIQDLSERGHQPMGDRHGHWRILFNGEIYNFPELRSDLEARGHRFTTGTDTEVLLAGWLEWGEDVLERTNGMFALAILDTRSGRLFLARDRLGIKPLYVHEGTHGFAFASEVKALLALEGVPRELDPGAVARFLTFLWVPEPGTLLRGIRQMEAGTCGWVEDGRLRARRWWDVPVPEPASEPAPEDATERLEALLHEAVKLRLVSDAPLGAFLSGGVDSSLVVAFMRTCGVDPVPTETVLFPPDADGYHVEEDDTPWARRVRDHFGDLDYSERLLTPDVAELLPRLTWHLDDPVADPAAIATYVICASARERRTVMLAGMGAEELFAGYPRHRATLLAEHYRRVPRAIRRHVLEAAVGLLPGGRPGRFLGAFRGAKKFVRSASLPFEDRYLGFSSYYTPREAVALVPGSEVDDPYGVHRAHLRRTEGLDHVTRMTHLDLKTFLPNLNLAYTDRASMAASVEVRVPFLDHRVVELAAQLPAREKIEGRSQKAVLKKVAARYLPSDVVHRPKAGFQAPVRAWIHRDLRPMVADVLAPDRLRARGVLDADAVWRVVDGAWSGKEDNALRVWAFLSFELWASTFLDGDGAAPIS